MADKIYEGGIPLGAGLEAEADGYFLMKAEDIQVGENKSLAEYIAEGGGGGSGDSSGVKIPVLQTTLTLDSTLQDMMDVLRANGITSSDYCLVKGGTVLFNDVIVQLSTYFNTGISVNTWYNISCGYSYSAAGLLSLDPSTTIGEVNNKAKDSLKTTSKTLVGAINELAEYCGGGTSTSAMPTIRFVGLRGNNILSNLDGEEQSVTFIIEVASGLLQVGDTLQICGMRTFWASPQNPTKKRKLRRFAELEIDEIEVDKNFLSLTVNPTKKNFAFLAHNNRQSGGPCDFYFRIRRPVGYLQNNDSGMTNDADFSNVVAVSMNNVIGEVQNYDDGSSSMSVKINIV